jgi:hypothetical protein
MTADLDGLIISVIENIMTARGAAMDKGKEKELVKRLDAFDTPFQEWMGDKDGLGL